MLRKSILAFFLATTLVTPYATRAVSLPPTLTQVSFGFSHACAVSEGGGVWCWGENAHNQASPLPDAYRLAPTPVDGVSNVKEIALGEFSTCALTTAGHVWCWGSTASGQLGSPDAEGTTPSEVTDLTDAVKISAGRRNYCVIRVDRSTWCWGRTYSRYGTFSETPYPNKVAGIPEAIDVAIGHSHGCILGTDSKVWCWGTNDAGQLGNGSPNEIWAPTVVSGLEGVTKISSQLYSTCAIDAAQDVWCWGYNNDGQLGIGTKSLKVVMPTRAAGISGVQKLWSGAFNTCAQNSLAEVHCWGWNFSGQLGTGNRDEHLSPVRLSVLSDIQTLGVGLGTTCAIAAGNSIWCWGANGSGQFGNGIRTEESLQPTQTLPPVLDSPSTPQLVLFSSIPNRTTSGARSFTVAASADSGLPVDIQATSSVCSVDGLKVTIWDIGTCTLTASQQGYGSFLPATSVVRQFSITRTMLLNKTISFLDADGVPANGVSVSWASEDGRYTSSKAIVTNAAGKITYSSIPGGKLRFTVTGKVSGWSGTGRVTELAMGSAVNVIIPVSSLAADFFSTLVVRVQLPDGSPVPKAQVYFGANCGYGNWTLDSCRLSKSNGIFTSTDGTAGLKVPQCFSSCGYVWAVFDDGEVSQRSQTIEFNDSGEAVIELEQLPVVDIETDAATINYGTAQTVTAIARGSDGSPIVGRSLTLSTSTSGASASCSGRKTTATTNSSGRATFKVCPVKTATWSVDGRSIVGSAGVRLTVQLTPTAPRTLIATPKTRSVSLTWAAPAKANAGSVTDYIVQYRLQGATTWITFRDGTYTARKATVTGLTSGQVYEFRVAAKNKSGTGTWSSTSLGSPN